MQTPQGFHIGEDGRLFPVDWLQIIFNPSFPYRLAHMVTAAYLTTALVVGGIGAFYLWSKKYVPQAKIMLGMATLMTALASPLQLIIGDMHGLNTLKYQPAKVAAMEGIWDTEKGAGLRLFALPDPQSEKNHYEITIPHLTSLILTHHYDGEVQGLKSFKKEDRPPVVWVFWSFRVMVGLGLLMILLSLTSVVQYYRKKLFDSRFLQGWWMLMMPSGFIAVLAGWFVNEIGRQPYTVYGVIRTTESVSPAIIGSQVGWSLLAFVIMYTLVFGAGSYYILKLIRKGIPAIKDEEQYYKHGTEASVIEGLTHQGDRHV